MKRLSLQDLEQRWAKVERAADQTPGIDPWCSGLDWSLAVARGFAPKGRRLLLESESGAGYALIGYYLNSGRQLFLSGLEPLWGFGSPIIGDIPNLIDELVEELDRHAEWTALALPGMPEPPHETTMTVLAGLAALGTVHVGEGITRQVADLTDGYDNWWEQRSSKFRRNLRRAERLAEEQGLEIVNIRHDPDVFDRIQAIEEQSWKGQDDSGVMADEMNRMYRYMVKRLQARGRLWAYVATAPSTPTQTSSSERIDVGYILGGLRNRRYRGLQISYVDSFADLSVGNLLQHHQIKALCHQHLADAYDMGMDIDYKRRWADRADTSVILMVTRTPDGVSPTGTEAE